MADHVVPDGPLCLASDVAWEDTGDQVLVIALVSGRINVLEGTARTLWLLAVEGHSPNAMTGLVAAEAGADHEDVLTSVDGFVSQLMGLDLLRQLS